MDIWVQEKVHDVKFLTVENWVCIFKIWMIARIRLLWYLDSTCYILFFTQSPSRGKGTWEEVTPSQSTSLDSPDTKSSLDKHVWSWGTAQKKSKCNCVSTGAQPWHPNTCNVTREGHRRIIHGNLRKGLARNCIKSKKLIIMGRHVVIIAVSQVAWATPCISLRELVE